MEDKRNLQDEAQDEVQDNVKDSVEARDELSDEQLDKVAGGSPLTDAVNQVIKALGEGLSSAARKG